MKKTQRRNLLIYYVVVCLETAGVSISVVANKPECSGLRLSARHDEGSSSSTISRDLNNSEGGSTSYGDGGVSATATPVHPKPGPSSGIPTAIDSESSGIATSHEPEPGPSSGNPTSNEDQTSEAHISTEGNWLNYSDLMAESYPSKSRVVYLKAFRLFEKFLKSRNQWEANTCPTDLQVLNYFYYLRNELKWAPTTLWSTYARINAVMKRLYGVSLNSFSRIGDVLKSYDSGHKVKKAGVFTPQQIEDFVSDPALSSKYWLVRKVVCLIGYYGGFRNKELKSLKFENCEVDNMGYWFVFERAKQRGMLEATSICVPRRQPDWIPVASDSSRVGLDFDPASLIDLYLSEVQADLLCSRDELSGDFFRATHGQKGQKFTKLSLGKNTIGRVGVQVATELCLARPEIYTGHCWRRSCGTSASDSGVNVTTLMAIMGWSSPKTAMMYVKKSRMTSLSMSLYLTNVQRRNCSNPFPKNPIEKRQAFKQQSVVSAPVAAKCSNTLVSSCNMEVSSETVGSVFKLEDIDDLSTQALIHDIESEELEFASQSVDIQEIGCNEGSPQNEIVPFVSKNDLVPASSKKDLVPVSTKKEELATLRRDAASGEANLERGAGVSSNSGSLLSNQLASVDSRLSGFLHNLQNTGNVTIHFHFDSNK